MATLRDTASAWQAQARPAVLVEVAQTRGSVPRGCGTRMLVSRELCAGTIGGGHLELKAIAQARAMLDAAVTAGAADTAPGPTTSAATAGNAATAPQSAHYPLGPALGQCCGGAVSLSFSLLSRAALQAWPQGNPRFHLQLFGAGHVGRAIARALAPLNVAVDWIDERDAEFPATFDEAGTHWPANIRKVCVDAVEAEVRNALPGAFYLVLTHQHDLDLLITEAVLARGDFGFLGLIGSSTKKARFIHRFEQRGIATERIARLVCPIGLPGIIGKEPEVIAASVVAQMLQLSSARGHA